MLPLPLSLQAALARFKLWCTPPTAPPRAAKRPAAALTEKGQLPVFRNGRALRDYQVRLRSCLHQPARLALQWLPAQGQLLQQ